MSEQRSEDQRSSNTVVECADGKHDYVDDYYGVRCRKCPIFYPYGCEPWAPEPEACDDACYDDDYQLDEFEEAMYDCHGFFDQQGPGGLFICGAVGSEDCDECPMHAWLGLTSRQIDRLEEEVE